MPNEKYEKKLPFFRKPWNRLTLEEQEEIIEKSKLKKEEAQKKENKKIADIMSGKQRTNDNSWE